jgi:hypothetical protein
MFKELPWIPGTTQKEENKQQQPQHKNKPDKEIQ